MKTNFSWKLIYLIAVLALFSVAAGCKTSTTNTPITNQNQQPLEIVSVIGPIIPYNPGGPTVRITVKNEATEPVVSLTTTLVVVSISPNQTYDFNFNVSSLNPLLPNNSITSTLALINGEFNDNTTYPLKIDGTFQNGGTFAYTEQVTIDEPPPATSTTSSQTSATVTAANGLSLTLSLASSTYKPGDRVSITIGENNVLTTENDIPAAGMWPARGLNVGPCGKLNYPFGISILQGDYDAQSMASITPLQLYDPNAVYNCPMILAGITSYDFQPSSDAAAIDTGTESEPISISMTTEITPAGFWAGNPATFNNFLPGIYTVVGGDEWGISVILHFTIS